MKSSKIYATIGLSYWLAPLLVAVVTVAYWPSFTAGLFLDDFRIIVESDALHKVFDPAAIWHFSAARFIASWTLAANYALHGDQVFGYHLVNFLIHLGAGAALWSLLTALGCSPALAAAPGRYRQVPAIAAVIFLLHPLQTQAVTYIVQRYTSLAAMFYLAALAAYAWARLGGGRPPGGGFPERLWRYGLVVLLAGLAMFSKQSAATLPLALLLLELLFFRRLSPRAWGMTIGAAVLLAAAAAGLVTLPAFDLVGSTRATDQIARGDYLATQMGVLWRYIGLFFWVGEQRLEYDVALASFFSDVTPWLLAAGHLVLLGSGLALWRRAPLISFGIVFYYLAHAVESGFMPIADLAFEHRTYLPNAGLAMVVALGLAWLGQALGRYRIGPLLGAALLLLLAGSTWNRNRLWADPIAFLQADARLSPGSQRAWTSLGKELMRSGRFAEALSALEEAQRIGVLKDSGDLRPPTLLNMLLALHYTGRNQEALDLAGRIDTSALNQTELAFFYEARGRARLALGDARMAREDLQRAAQTNPSIAVVTFLAAAEYELGHRARAHHLAAQVLQSDPENTLAREIHRRTE